jgi:hypothetical protein
MCSFALGGGRPPSGRGCAECLGSGFEWVHLCICMARGHVGCCNCSPHRHAMGHWLVNRDHPLVRSYEDSEDWWWCYQEELRFEVNAWSMNSNIGVLGFRITVAFVAFLAFVDSDCAGSQSPRWSIRPREVEAALEGAVSAKRATSALRTTSCPEPASLSKTKTLDLLGG